MSNKWYVGLKKIVVLVCALQFAPVAFAGDPEFNPDSRKLVDMPPEVVTILRQEMIGFVVAFQQVAMLVIAEKYQEAADLAEDVFGHSAMIKRSSRYAPAQFMLPGMHGLMNGLRQSGSEWAVALRAGDKRRIGAGLVRVTGFCVACHQTFHVRRTIVPGVDLDSDMPR